MKTDKLFTQTMFWILLFLLSAWVFLRRSWVFRCSNVNVAYDGQQCFLLSAWVFLRRSNLTPPMDNVCALVHGCFSVVQTLTSPMIDNQVFLARVRVSPLFVLNVAGQLCFFVVQTLTSPMDMHGCFSAVHSNLRCIMDNSCVSCLTFMFLITSSFLLDG